MASPTLKVVTQSELRKFDNHYRAYIEKVDEANANRNGRALIRKDTIKDCIDRNLLEGMCNTREFGDDIDVFLSKPSCHPIISLNVLPILMRADILFYWMSLSTRSSQWLITSISPFKSEGSSKDALVFTSRQTANSTITITLPAPNLPLRIFGVTFYVIDQPTDEIILGRPFLPTIGFDLTDFLQRVMDKINNKDLSEIDADSLEVASTTYRGLAYTEPAMTLLGYQMVFRQILVATLRKLIDEQLKRIVSEAKENGMFEEGVSNLTQMLEVNRDAFRVNLGPDPPAKVAPLGITAIPNAKPYRTPMRNYAPLQRDFLVRTIREL